MFFVLIFCALKYHAAANFLIDGPQVTVKASKMAVVFGECGLECFTGPGNTERSAALVWQCSSRQTADDMTAKHIILPVKSEQNACKKTLNQ